MTRPIINCTLRKENILFFRNLRHSGSMHFSDCSSSSGHSTESEFNILCRVRIPSPHVTLHSLQADQGDNMHGMVSSEKKNKKKPICVKSSLLDWKSYFCSWIRLILEKCSLSCTLVFRILKKDGNTILNKKHNFQSSPYHSSQHQSMLGIIYIERYSVSSD